MSLSPARPQLAAELQLVQKRPTSFVLPNTAAIAALSAGAKVAGAVKTIVMARMFGASSELDWFLLTFLVVSFVSEVLCGPIVPLLVPRLVTLCQGQDEASAQDAYMSMLRRSVAGLGSIAIGLGLLCFFASPNPDSRVGNILSLLPWMLPILPLSAASNVWRAVLNANNRFKAAAGAVALTPAITVVVLLLGHADVYRLAIATTLGSVAEATVVCAAVVRLGWPVLGKLSISAVPRIEFSKRQYAYLASAALITNAAVFLNQSMAASLEAGAVAVLNFGTRLTGVLSAIGPEALAVSLLPVFSKLFFSDPAHFARSVRKVVFFSMLGATAITGLLIVLTPLIVRVVFQHGAFQSDDAELVVVVQRLSLLQLPFTLGIALTIRAIAAAKANRVMVPITAVGVGINVLLNIVWMRSYSVAGLAAAGTVGQICTFTILAVVAFRVLRAIEKPSC